MSTELGRLAADLSNAGTGAGVEATKVLKKGANNVKRLWRENAAQSSGRTAPAYSYSIDYDIEVIGHTVTAVIGPDKDKAQGALGNLLEFGSAHNPAHMDGQRALDSEADAYARFMDDAAGRLL